MSILISGKKKSQSRKQSQSRNHIREQKQNGIHIDQQPKRTITNKYQRLRIIEEPKKN